MKSVKAKTPYLHKAYVLTIQQQFITIHSRSSIDSVHTFSLQKTDF